MPMQNDTPTITGQEQSHAGHGVWVMDVDDVIAPTNVTER